MKTQQIQNHIWCLDTGYLGNHSTAAYLLSANDSLAMVDCGVNSSVPLLLEQVSHLGFEPSQIEALFLTHAHLDHAGGAGSLLPHLPNATIYAHEAALNHLIEPEKLERGVRAVYGDEFYDRMYGKIIPLDAARCKALGDGDVISLQNKTLQAVYTPGHAWHHHVFYCAEESVIFAGDALGLSDVGVEEGDEETFNLYIPSTPPSQFHPEEMMNSFDKILQLQADRLCITHYGVLQNPQEGVKVMKGLIEQSIQLIHNYHALSDEELCDKWTDICLQQVPSDLHNKKPKVFKQCQTILRQEAQLNISGLRYWINKQLLK